VTAITLDQPRELFFNVAVLCNLERVLNGCPTGLMLDHLKQLNLTVLTAALWAGLTHAEPQLELHTVRQRLQTYIDGGGTLDTLFTQLTAALDASGVFRESNTPRKAKKKGTR
jgi:hypothetical protein